MSRSFPPVSLIGAPTDIGAGHRGARLGPEALRIAGLGEALVARGIDVADRGNLDGPRNPWQPPTEGYRHLPEVVAWNRAVMDAVAAPNCAPAACRSCSAATIAWAWARSPRSRAIAARPASNCACCGSMRMPISTPARSRLPATSTACRWPACAASGPRELTHLGGDAPAMRPEEIRQIGIRSVDEGEKRLVKEYGLDVYDMRYIDEVGMKRAMEEALEGVDENTHLHVSFDVDFLDPSIAPGVGTTVPGGPNYREAQLVMEMIADSGRMASLDIMELNPVLDNRNGTAVLAVDLVESLFGKSTLMRD